MFKFKDLMMEGSGLVVFTFGRFNPPTIGHEKVIDTVKTHAGTAPYRIYPSHTQNSDKDPLPHSKKIAYMRKIFRKHSKNIIADKKAAIAIEITTRKSILDP